MRGRRTAMVLVLLAVNALVACTIQGTPTWPGARLERTLLTAADFPPGVQFDRIVDRPGTPDGEGGPPAMLSQPEGCSDGLTRVISDSAERGPGSAATYRVAYDGARIVVTVLTSELDLDQVAATATRCEVYLTFFDERSPAIPITTTELSSPRPGALAYQQTMLLQGLESSIYLSFENIGGAGMFGIAFPAPDPSIPVKATLPQTFRDVIDRQAERLG